ncbi:MAG: nitroreductase family protein [Melioribacteraceae bacterium]|nr:MAG: nitroreductase family protein [Melioribacteraceae bacterium]
MNNGNFITYKSYVEYPHEEMIKRSKEFYEEVNRRRTIREFSNREIPKEVIMNCLKAAGTAPSGANMQPWKFVVVENREIKKKIRIAAEEEEREFYNSKAPQEWLDALAPLGTDEHKPFLETAPYLIVIFESKYEPLPDGRKVKQYYTKESVGIATGILITALHHAGIATLTHTPSPMNFLNDILERPANEKPYLILVAGYPQENVTVPNIKRKVLEEIAVFHSRECGNP